MQHSGVCRWLRQQQQLLLMLLLLFAAAIPLLGHCSRAGVGVESGLSASNELEANVVTPPVPEPSKTGAEQEDAMSIQSLPAQEGAGRTTTRSSGRQSRRNTLVMLALLLAALASVAAAERQLAAALAAAKKSEEGDAAAAAEAKGKLKRGQAAARRILDEIALVQRERGEAAESFRLLQEWKQRQASRAAESLVAAAKDKDAEGLQKLLCRVRKAEEMRNLKLAELEMEQLKRTLTEREAPELIATIQAEEEKLDAAAKLHAEFIRELEDAKTGEEAKERQLPLVLASVKALKEEVEKLETERAATASAELLTDPDKLSTQLAELEMKKDMLLLAREEDELYAGIEEAEIRRLSRQLNLAETEEKKLSMELADLRARPLIFVIGRERLEAAAEKFKEKEEEIKSFMKQLATEEVIPKEMQDLVPLYPEEMALFQARYELERLKAHMDALTAERALYDDTKEKEGLDRAREELSKAMAFADFAELSAPPDEEETPEYQESLQRAEAAVSVAECQLEEKRARRKTLELFLKTFYEQVLEATEKVERYKRKKAEMERKILPRLEHPEAFALAEEKRVSTGLPNLEEALREIKFQHMSFSEDMFLETPKGHSAEAFWRRRLQHEADDYIEVLAALLKQQKHMMVAVDVLSGYLRAESMVEQLQPLPLADLLSNAAHEGKELQVSLVEEWQAELEKKLSDNLKMQEAAREDIQRVKGKLDDLATIKYWARDYPQKMMAALSYIMRKEYDISLLEEQHTRLSALSESGLTQEVRRCLLEAINQALWRRQTYGSDAAVLHEVHEARLQALAYMAARMERLRSMADRLLEDFAPVFDVSLLPVVVPRRAPLLEPRPAPLPAPEGAVLLNDDVHAYTLPGVLQLRKKPEKDSKDR